MICTIAESKSSRILFVRIRIQPVAKRTPNKGTANKAGTVYAVGTYTTGADVAENYPTSDGSLEPGDVVAADGTTPVQVVKATSTSPILGVVSTKPGVLLNGYKPLTDVASSGSVTATTVPVALSGRVPVKVSSENGTIQPGDYLAASSIHPGYAAKAVAAGPVIGRALERFGESGSDLGKILMFMQSGYYQPTVADLLQSSTASQDSGWLNSLGDLNMTDASVFGNIAVRGSVAIQKDLHVAGVIYAATLNVDTLITKMLCLDDVCISKPELQQLLQLLHNGSAVSTGSSGGFGSSVSDGSVAGTSTTSSANGADAGIASPNSSSTDSSASPSPADAPSASSTPTADSGTTQSSEQTSSGQDPTATTTATSQDPVAQTEVQPTATRSPHDTVEQDLGISKTRLSLRCVFGGQLYSPPGHPGYQPKDDPTGFGVSVGPYQTGNRFRISNAQKLKPAARDWVLHSSQSVPSRIRRDHASAIMPLDWAGCVHRP